MVGGHTTKTLGRPIGWKPDRVPNESREIYFPPGKVELLIPGKFISRELTTLLI